MKSEVSASWAAATDSGFRSPSVAAWVPPWSAVPAVVVPIPALAVAASVP